MSKIKLETTKENASAILDILIQHQNGYSEEFAPERIVLLREFISQLKEKIG